MAKQSDGQRYFQLDSVAGDQMPNYNTQAQVLRMGKNRQQAISKNGSLVTDEESLAYYNFVQGNGENGMDVADLSIDTQDWK